MEEIVINELRHDGMRRVRLVADFPLSMPTLRWLRLVPAAARSKVQTVDQHDQLLGIFSMELTWPVFEPYEVFIYGPKRFRRLMMVHFSFAERVSECIRLGVEAFWCGTHLHPRYAFIRALPRGSEDAMEVHGVQLLEAEWMPAQCVAIGGRDG